MDNKESKSTESTEYQFNYDNILPKYRKVKEKFPAVLQQNFGLITPSCKAVGINRATYYLWKLKDPEFERACDDVMEAVGDWVESKLYEAIDEKNAQLIKYYCSTKLQHRGYIERKEQNITINPVDKTVKEIYDRYKELFDKDDDDDTM